MAHVFATVPAERQRRIEEGEEEEEQEEGEGEGEETESPKETGGESYLPCNNVL